MDTSKFCGAGAALITPFKKDFSYDIEALESLIDYIIDGGTDYIVALGTTAETPTIKPSDRGNILHIIKQRIASRVPLVAGLGGNCTAEVVEYVEHTDLEGIDAILSVTPYYNKPSQEGLYRHFRAIAEAFGIGLMNVYLVSSLKKKSHVMKYVFYYLTALKIEGASDREIEREARRMALSYPGGEKP